MSGSSEWRGPCAVAALLTMAAVTSPAAAQETAAPPGPSHDPRDPRNDPRDDAHAPSLVAPLFAFSLGAAGFIGFGITGAMWLGEKSEVDELCPEHRCASQDGLDAAARAQRIGVVNGVALGLGIVATATGGILLWKAHQDVSTEQPEAAKAEAALRFVGNGVTFDARF